MAKIFSLFCYLFLSLFAVSQTVDFTFQSTNSLFCTSSTIQFTQNCTGNPTGFIWNLGNGLKSTTPDPSTSYIYPGNYVVKLIALYPQGPIEISKTIIISPDIVPKLVADRNFICQPGVINFTTNSNGNIASYEWDFGDTTGISTTQPNVNSHTFANYGTHSVIVKATDASGCFGYDSIQVDIQKLPITATVSKGSGCIPVTETFTANVTPPLNSSITNYLWNFADGSPPSSTTSKSINHVYGTVGSYLPTLTVTTSEGCSNTYDFPSMAYGTPPSNPVAYPTNTVICGSDTTMFIGKATNANRYLWWSREDNLYANITDTIALYKYPSLGKKTVYFTAYYNDCGATVSPSFQIDVIGVIAKFTYKNNCTDKRTFTFTNTSLGNQTSVVWDFGDGSAPVTTKNATHTFPASGQFKTLLTITDAITGCTDTVSRIVYTSTPTLENNDTTICKNTNTTFTILNSYSNPGASYTWDVVGRPKVTTQVPTETIRATILGNFNNYVVIRNGSTAQYCLDTIFLNHKILVRGPSLDFTVPPTICFSNLVDIVNKSTASIPGDSVLLWYWNYGNSLANDTIYQPPPVEYGAPRTYRIRLSGVDINGCRDSLRKSITVYPLPRLQVSPRVDTLCAGQSDTIFISHSDSILWTPSNGLSCTNCDTVLASPSVTTQYFITTTTSSNCTIKDSVLINVIPNFTAIPTKVNQYICLNDRVTLDVGPKDKVVVWSPTTGLSNPNVYTPTARPRKTTTYTATLTDSTGCFTSTADMTVFIKSLPTVDAGIDRTLPYNSTFTISPTYSSNVRSYLWTPSSLLNCSTCAVPGGVAVSTESYQVQVTSDSGCIAKDSITIAIECKESNLLMPTAFSPNNDNLNDFYYPLARGIKTILRFSIYNREGQLLYEARDFLPNNRSFAWNGEFKGARQSPRAYVYILDALCDSGERISKSGSFLLLR